MKRKMIIPAVRLLLVVMLLTTAVNMRADYYTCYEICEGNYVGCKSQCSWYNPFCEGMCMSMYRDCARTCDGNGGQGAGPENNW